MDIVQYLGEHPGASLNELARAFEVSRAAITQNIHLLSAAGVVDVRLSPSRRGGGKSCFLTEREFHVTIHPKFDTQKMYVTEIPIGQYTDYSISPPCGIATREKVIGIFDDPRFFDAPEHTQAGILWCGGGYIEYRLPNFIEPGHVPIEMRFDLELSSEAPGYSETWPSEITFSLNDQPLCAWVSPGDYGDHKGLFTPEWWSPEINQYGLQKQIKLNGKGTFIDGVFTSPVVIGDLALSAQSELRFRLSVPVSGLNAGGLTIYGKGFGNYDHAIKFRVIYDDPLDREGKPSPT